MTVILIPECKKHKTQSCMRQYYVGDGVNHPIDLIWLCKRTMDSKSFKLMRKNHGAQEVSLLECKRIMNVLRKCALIDRYDFAVEEWKVFLGELEKIITPKEVKE